MADDFDVEDMLEAPYRKDNANQEVSAELSPTGSAEEGKKKKSKRRHRSRSRSPHKKHSRRRSRSRSRDRRNRSRSRERKRRSRSRDRKRSRSRDKRRSRSRDRRRSRSRDKRISRSRDRLGSQNESRSPQRRDSWAKEKTLPNYKRVGGRVSPDPEPPSEDKDRRTVMCMQLAAYVGPKELEEFFQKVGQVKEVKMIADKNSRRSKGIAYVEFHDESSVPVAMQLTGQKLYGVPIIVQPTMAEKNRLAAAAQNLMKKEGPRKLYVGSLHYNISEDMLKKIFEPFGYVEKLNLSKDENGLSKGFGFVEFRDAEASERAMINLNGFELAGRPMKVNLVTHDQVGGMAMEFLDQENFTTGVGMTQQGRANLMAKLAEGHNAGLTVPTIPALAQPPAATTISTCFMLSNMFDTSHEIEPGWEEDIREDVLEECTQFGPVLHVHVDIYSQGNVYVKCVTPQIAAAAFNSLNGRFFAGKKIVALFIPDTTYHAKFPESLLAAEPLKVAVKDD